ncbi:DEAD/DEAH box helicase family protein [Pedobacter sp. D749]|uniref:DEAD/DEAH box helicase family protein n=1 Tax=Pedobacter sp. D749 TaxID=2856523 RepID=UPI001C575C3B|nr:DEAD/DEAH box helicase family protein [Pedobacter sp. D749]QXU41457.1 DEAD/DEAH box helicase family protein [Pedobacter sp. D749]
MLNTIDWPRSRSYRTGSEYEPIQFYLDGLSNSIRFDLLLGYFSSAAISVLSLGFARFIYGGGNLRVIANHILSKIDKETLITASQKQIQSPIDLSDIGAIKGTLDEYDIHFFQCLSYLINNKRIDIKIVKSKGKGIVHYKSGVFDDGKHKTSFKASCNFTAYGLLENAEELDATLSWDNALSSDKIEDQENYFEQIFSGNADFVEYINPIDILEAIKDNFGDKSIDELLIQEKELIEKKSIAFSNPKLKKKLRELKEEIENIQETPRFPYPEGPRAYQAEAYRNWVDNNYQGVFAMATGTGKTITSLNCVLQEYFLNPEKTYHAIILVPTISLVEQWAKEAKMFNLTSIIKVSSKTKWENDLSTTLSTSKRIPVSFIIITTYASFIKDKFFKEIKKIPSDTILIADEAHNIGATSVLVRLLNFPLQKRIGLSATPRRAYDIEGSIGMESFFNDKEPYTYSFSMERAIEEGILCKYYYHPHIVHLTNEELVEYVEISKKLAKFFNKVTQQFNSPEIAEMLLLKRKRIIHKAENKLSKTISILKERYHNEGSLKYTFIYVPEGTTEDNTQDLAEELDEVDTIKIINQYTRAVGKLSPNIRVNQFISGMKNRDEILQQFKLGKIDVIASMKCLDEGIDIPRAEHAIFCSSTGNPRQFIQRRGRILRKHDDKNMATIHDLVVIPDLSTSHEFSETFNLERNMVQKELERVMNFSSLAINPYETETAFEEICNHYNLNIYTIHQNLNQ